MNLILILGINICCFDLFFPKGTPTRGGSAGLPVAVQLTRPNKHVNRRLTSVFLAKLMAFFFLDLKVLNYGLFGLS